MKIALIGQDIPTLLPSLLTDLLFVGREAAALHVEEKNAAMQDVLQRYGDAVIRHSGVGAKLSVSGDRADVLDGADCVIYAGDYMAASRFKMDREALSGVEEDDPGLTEQARVNGGIGGLMHTLRQGEMILDLCEQMQAYCPEALVITLGQPVARTALMFVSAGFRTFGLGRTPMRGANGLDSLTKKLNCKPDDVNATVAGLPGFSFLLEMTDRKTGDDLLPLLMDLAEEEQLGRLTKRWLDWYGVIAMGDVTDHAEWLPAQDDFIPDEEPVFGETVERRKERILWMNTVGDKGAEDREGQMAQILLLSKAVPIRPMQLALSILRGDDCDIPAVTRTNNGELTSLPKYAMIESTLTQRGGSIVPHGIALSPALADICGDIDETNRLAARAATGDRIALRECIEVDPALAGLDRLYVQDLVDKMIEMHSDILNRFDDEEE